MAVNMMNDIEEILFTKEEIASVVKRLGAQITKDYSGKNLLLLGILKGSALFLSDLMREIDLPLKIEFLSVSSYGSGTTTTGEVKVRTYPSIAVEGVDVLIVEDILDSGNTLHCLKGMLGDLNPQSLRICTLFDKPERREAPVYADYIGATVPNAFIVGYGLDYDEIYRNLPFVGVLKPEVYGG